MNSRLPEAFLSHAPTIQSFQIIPGKKQTITGERGTRITVPPDAFAASGPVELKLVEVTDTFDALAVNQSLEFEQNGQPALFESAGMFNLRAYDGNKPLQLRPGARLGVQFPNRRPGDKFNVYTVKDGKWKHHGHNQEVPACKNPLKGRVVTADDKALPGVNIKVNDVSVAITDTKGNYDFCPSAGLMYIKFTKVGFKQAECDFQRRDSISIDAKMATEDSSSLSSISIGDVWTVGVCVSMADRKSGGLGTIGTRLYQIDSLSWWNFDYPRNDLMCIDGFARDTEGKFASVTVLALDDIAMYRQPAYEGHFRISFMQKTRVRVLVTAGEKAGISKTFTTWQKAGHHKVVSSDCMQVGAIKLKRVPEKFKKSKKALYAYLGLKLRNEKVRYAKGGER